MKPVGLEGSGGSTPLKMRVVDEQGNERSIFAKLYAKNHVRADRWYKLGRTMLYGRLEDETPFSTVRRFVEYEDYTLRLLGEKGFSTPEPLDIVEITPEREYLIAMEFFEDAVEISEAEVDERIIDDGLQLIRKMWDVGLSHRDIKPANLMVQDGRLRLIDVFFVQVRPSPWRQAVDLGNMMLVLALRSDPELVYQKALAYFTPEELAEAFAATRGVASPTQLRASMKADGRDLLETFRGLAPARKPIGIQRWSVRRVLLIIATVLLLMLCVLTGVALFIPSRGEVGNANCGTGRTMQLMAQAVPTARQLPCIDDLPLGWGTEQASIVRDRATFTVGIGSDLTNPVIVTLVATCPARHRRSRRSRSKAGASPIRSRPGPSRGRCPRSSRAAAWRTDGPQRAGRRGRARRGPHALRRGCASVRPGLRDGSCAGGMRSVLVRPRGNVDLVALGVGQGPPPGCVVVVDDVTTRGDRRRDPRLRLVMRHVEIDVDPVALRARRVHLLEPDGRILPMGVEEVLVADLLVAEDGAPERQHVGDHERIDRDLDHLQAGQIDGDAEFPRCLRDLPRPARESPSLNRPSLFDLKRTVTPSGRRSTSG